MPENTIKSLESLLKSLDLDVDLLTDKDFDIVMKGILTAEEVLKKFPGDSW